MEIPRKSDYLHYGRDDVKSELIKAYRRLDIEKFFDMLELKEWNKWEFYINPNPQVTFSGTYHKKLLSLEEMTRHMRWLKENTLLK